MRFFFVEVANRDIFAFKLVFAPQSEEIELALLGMSDYSRRGTQISFPLVEILAVSRISE